jgi:hypothetical protein
MSELLNCVDVAKDPVWIGKTALLLCLNAKICKPRGTCEWRRFHALRPEQFRAPVVVGHEIMKTRPRRPPPANHPWYRKKRKPIKTAGICRPVFLMLK